MPTVIFDPEQTKLERALYAKIFPTCKWPDAVLVEVLQNQQNLTLLDARNLDPLVDGVHQQLAKFLYAEIVFSPVVHALDGRVTGPLNCLWASSRPGSVAGFADRVRIHGLVSCIVESKESAWTLWFLSQPINLFDSRGGPSEAVPVLEHLLQKIANVFDGDRTNVRVDTARLHVPASYFGSKESLRRAHQLKITTLDETATFSLDTLAERFGLTEKPTKRPSEESEDRLYRKLQSAKAY